MKTRWVMRYHRIINNVPSRESRLAPRSDSSLARALAPARPDSSATGPPAREFLLFSTPIPNSIATSNIIDTPLSKRRGDRQRFQTPPKHPVIAHSHDCHQCEVFKRRPTVAKADQEKIAAKIHNVRVPSGVPTATAGKPLERGGTQAQLHVHQNDSDSEEEAEKERDYPKGPRSMYHAPEYLVSESYLSRYRDAKENAKLARIIPKAEVLFPTVIRQEALRAVLMLLVVPIVAAAWVQTPIAAPTCGDEIMDYASWAISTRGVWGSLTSLTLWCVLRLTLPTPPRKLFPFLCLGCMVACSVPAMLDHAKCDFSEELLSRTNWSLGMVSAPVALFMLFVVFKSWKDEKLREEERMRRHLLVTEMALANKPRVLKNVWKELANLMPPPAHNAIELLDQAAHELVTLYDDDSGNARPNAKPAHVPHDPPTVAANPDRPNLARQHERKHKTIALALVRLFLGGPAKVGIAPTPSGLLDIVDVSYMTTCRALVTIFILMAGYYAMGFAFVDMMQHLLDTIVIDEDEPSTLTPEMTLTMLVAGLYHTFALMLQRGITHYVEKSDARVGAALGMATDALCGMFFFTVWRCVLLQMPNWYCFLLVCSLHIGLEITSFALQAWKQWFIIVQCITAPFLLTKAVPLTEEQQRSQFTLHVMRVVRRTYMRLFLRLQLTIVLTVAVLTFVVDSSSENSRRYAFGVRGTNNDDEGGGGGSSSGSSFASPLRSLQFLFFQLLMDVVMHNFASRVFSKALPPQMKQLGLLSVFLRQRSIVFCLCIFSIYGCVTGLITQVTVSTLE